MAKHHVYLCQVNNQYGDNVFLPYSVAMIAAYCQTIEAIDKAYAFKELMFLREDPERVAARLDRPRVVGISCYVWNWEYSRTLAQTIKARHPDCLIVLGGPHVPLRSEGFFAAHPYVDLLVHYEGEMPFADILLEGLKPSPDYASIPGLSVRLPENETLKSGARPRNLDLAKLPSPYLTGLFDDLIRRPYAFHASQETHRGCPYSCAFCDWGSATMNKVRAFDDQRLEQEFDWFGKHKIDLLYNCDANYGLLPRDYALTVKLADTKSRYGFPRKFRAAYAKNSTMKIFEIAKVLNQAEMCKGVTLSFQSMDAHTLEVIRRSNIKIDDFAGLMRLYRTERIPTYTEIILGLAGETYESFVDGLNTLLAAGQHDSLNVYTCTVLPNAEMGTAVYRELHGIETVRVPVMLTHSTPSTDPITEYNDMVVGTKMMSRAEWQRAYLFSWAVQCFHCLSLTQCLAVFLHTEHGISYRAFYEGLLAYAAAHPESRIGRQYRLVSDTLAGVLQGRAWDIVIPKFGHVVWPPEEGTFLNLVVDKDGFYGEMAQFLGGFVRAQGISADPELLRDVLAYQAHVIIDPYSPKRFDVKLEHNVHDYLVQAYVGQRTPIAKTPTTLEIEADAAYGGDLETYARNVIWYGRKGGRFRHSNISVRDTAAAASSAGT